MPSKIEPCEIQCEQQCEKQCEIPCGVSKTIEEKQDGQIMAGCTNNDDSLQYIIYHEGEEMPTDGDGEIIAGPDAKYESKVENSRRTNGHQNNENDINTANTTSQYY